jgi:hypothetical protein
LSFSGEKRRCADSSPTLKENFFLIFMMSFKWDKTIRSCVPFFFFLADLDI